MTAPQSPAPAQPLLDEIGDALQMLQEEFCNRNCINLQDEHFEACSEALDVLDRYRAAKAAEPDLRRLLSSLEKAEHDYRLVYQSHGGGHMNTAQCWDRLRKAGDAARAVLAAAQAKEGRNE